MRAGKIAALTLALLLSCSMLMAGNNAANIWASVQFNKRSVVVGEALMVTITVYTSTWFTSPPKFSEIQVPDAIMVEYQQRTGSMRKTIGNKTYPAIEKKFLVYPLKVGENSLPGLSIVTESPHEGDYKGQRRVITSPERTFQVTPAPEGIGMEQWLTAYNVSLSEHWDRVPDQLKQGDVLERQISIRASGALASLIPPLQLSATGFGNLYPRGPVLNNVQNEASFTGTRTESWTYLMETEGSFSIPGITVSWYDPQSKKVESTEIGSRDITIAANPDLNFLLSMQDSLQAMLETGEAGISELFQWMGLNWWQLTVVIITLIVVLYMAFRLLLRLVSSFKKRKAAAIESEERYFEEFLRVSKNGDPASVMAALHCWYDRYRSDRFGPVFGDFICAADDPELKTHFTELEQILFSGAASGSWSGRKLAAIISRNRRSLAGNKATAHQEEFALLNPET